MDQKRFSLRCANLIFEKANKFFEDKNYERAIDLYNFSIAIKPTNVAAWINICECKKQLDLEDEDYLRVMRHMSETGQIDLDKIMAGDLDAENYAPEQPLHVPEELKKYVEIWRTGDFAEHEDVMQCYAESFFEEVFSGNDSNDRKKQW